MVEQVLQPMHLCPRPQLLCSSSRQDAGVPVVGSVHRGEAAAASQSLELSARRRTAGGCEDLSFCNLEHSAVLALRALATPRAALVCADAPRVAISSDARNIALPAR